MNLAILIWQAETRHSLADLRTKGRYFDCFPGLCCR